MASTGAVLIVDDSPDVRHLFAAALASCGLRALVARDGREGVALAREHEPRLILLDLAMPRMDGVGAMAKLREDPRTAAIPVLAVSGYDVSADELRRLGFRGLIRKPVTPLDLARVVRSCLEDAARGIPWSDAASAPGAAD
jgi:CheY-like chemotaxis protein